MIDPSPQTHVLLVDDDSMSRELLAALLEREGYRVTACEGLVAALAALPHGAEADLVLTDLHMPDAEPAQLSARLRALCAPGAPLVAISGSQPSPAVAALFDDFLLKPFRVSAVSALLRRRSSDGSIPAAAQSVASSAPTTASAPPAQASQESASVSAAPPPNTPPNAPPILNETIYQQLAVAIPGPQLHEMYALCVNDARRRIAVMRTSLDACDSARFVREAHAIKGSCGMLGATQLHGMADSLERGGLGTAASRVNSLDDLAAACDRLERMLGTRV